MRRLGLRPDEFEEVFSRSSGPGGQNVNKVSTAVTLVHRPSGLSVTVQDTRSQYRNRQLAVNRLITLIEETRKRASRRAQIGDRTRTAPEFPTTTRSPARNPKIERTPGRDQANAREGIAGLRGLLAVRGHRCKQLRRDVDRSRSMRRLKAPTMPLDVFRDQVEFKICRDHPAGGDADSSGSRYEE